MAFIFSYPTAAGTSGGVVRCYCKLGARVQVRLMEGFAAHCRGNGIVTDVQHNKPLLDDAEYCKPSG